MMVEVYCDGSGTTMDLPGGYGYVIVVDGVKMTEGSGHLPKATNNRAELSAAIEGLKVVQAHPKWSKADVVIVSDSQLVLGYANGSYKLKAMHLVDVYNAIRLLYKSMKVSTRWVRGHTGDKYNEECDKLAKAARNNSP